MSISVLADNRHVVVEEQSMAVLAFLEPGTGTYSDIRWYKGTHQNRVAFYREGLNNNQVLYSGELCDGAENCLGSSQGAELNIMTGELKFESVQFKDAGSYFYSFFTDTGHPNTGLDYQIDLTVSGKHGYTKHHF